MKLCIGWAWSCVSRGDCFLTSSSVTQVVDWLGLTLCADGGLFAFVFTSSFGTEVEYLLGLTLCTNDSHCFFSNILFWH